VPKEKGEIEMITQTKSKRGRIEGFPITKFSLDPKHRLKSGYRNLRTSLCGLRIANNNSIGNRNQGVDLYSIKPLFPMVDFQWKVDLIYIIGNFKNPLVSREQLNIKR
jgi:hypothetical protein